MKVTKPGKIPLYDPLIHAILHLMASTSRSFIPVKLCYSHIGGQLGSLLSEQFIAKKWIEPVNGNERLYSVTVKGKKAFTEMGIDLSLITPQVIE